MHRHGLLRVGAPNPGREMARWRENGPETAADDDECERVTGPKWRPVTASISYSMHGVA